MNDKPFHVAFYSYRGGAERLAALVNVGVDLAQRGYKVLLVDFDLQAPGLAALAPLRPEKPHTGLVEYLTEYLDTNDQAPPVGDYLYRTAFGKDNGELWVMPAGKEDADYWAALARINWQELYDLHAGFQFFEDTIPQWRQIVQADYVLINAPGGSNELTGICTRQLPDLVMLLADPDATDRAGLQLAVSEIRADMEENVSKDIAVALALIGLPDIPDAVPHRLREYVAGVAGGLGLDRVDALVHRSGWCLTEERPIIQARPRGRAALEYHRLAEVCMAANCENDREGARLFLKRLRRNLERDPLRPFAFDGGEALRREQQLERVLVRFIRDQQIVLIGTACLLLARRYHKAMYTLDLALEEQKDAVQLRLRRAELNAEWNQTQAAVQDLLSILDAPGATADEKQVMETMRRLRELAPEKFQEARRKPAVQALGKINLRLLSLLQPGQVRSAFSRPDDIWSLLSEHRWAEAIGRLAPKVDQDSDVSPWDAFHLALAYWGSTGQLRQDLCQRGIDKFLDQRGDNAAIDLSDCQLVSLMFWGAGDAKNALHVLSEAEDRADDLREGGESEFPTFWRGLSVSFDQFKEDCQDQRLMIRGAKIRPPIMDAPVVI